MEGRWLVDSSSFFSFSSNWWKSTCTEMADLISRFRRKIKRHLEVRAGRNHVTGSKLVPGVKSKSQPTETMMWAWLLACIDMSGGV